MFIDQLDLFFAGCLGAAATLIGFLAVANSIISTKSGKSLAATYFGILAESSYTALANIFFISLVAMIPFFRVGSGMTIVAIASIVAMIRIEQRAYKRLGKSKLALYRVSKTMKLVSLAVFIAELVVGVVIWVNPDSVLSVGVVYIVIALFTIGIERAWELLGVQRVLQEEDE